MNERIKELAEQCYHRYSEHHIDLEKFAELVVQKFDDLLMLEYLDCVGSQDNRSKQRIQLLREKVKIYFGVEE